MLQVENGLKIFDITNSTHITECGFYYAGNTGNRINGLDVYNSTFAVTAEGGLDSKGTLRIINISNPGNPFISDSLQIGSNTSNNHVKIDGNYIYHSSGSAGLMLFSWNSVAGMADYSYNKSKMNIYPNPSTNNITIDVSASSATLITSTLNMQATIEITNIQGLLIKTIAANGNKINIDVSAFPSGVYVVEVKTEKGISVKKFVKE
jgi:hypothetical protein